MLGFWMFVRVSLTVRERGLLRCLVRWQAQTQCQIEDCVVLRYIDPRLFMDKIDSQGRDSTTKSRVTLTESSELQSHSWCKLPITILCKGVEPVYLCSSMHLEDCQSLKYSKASQCLRCRAEITRLEDHNAQGYTVVVVKRPLGVGDWPSSTRHLRPSIYDADI